MGANSAWQHFRSHDTHFHNPIITGKEILNLIKPSLYSDWKKNKFNLKSLKS